jgi:uncharacterized phage protein (predicted DNA packaging)
MTLNDVKQALNIDFDDQDQYLTTVMNAAGMKAATIIGEEIIIASIDKDNNPEVYNAILDDIAVMYQNRGEKESVSETSIRTYRRLSKTPMI